LAGDLVVTVGEYVSLHHHCFSHDPLDGKAATIDLRPNTFDEDATAAVDVIFWHAL
jgi:hypothetical protein